MDLQYIDKGLFTSFIPVSSAGENAWRELAEQTDGTGTVFTFQAKAYITQLRAVGYKVSKAKPAKITAAEIDELLAELYN